ncbi:unnamed protein product [Cunninghamella blakesleeana]
MKFAGLTAIVFGAVACLGQNVASTPPTAPTTGQRELMPASKCNTAALQCCNELKKYDELNLKQQSSVSNFIGGAINALHGQFGVDCTSVSVMGLAGNQCNAQTVCCENVESSALIAITCVPVNINL